ncbi:MAG: hypothetical protein K6D02_06990, partial [Lachnospiraceae bacterium]|nr:hypothetical protein [Lachnospiraceae bacterium]
MKSNNYNKIIELAKSVILYSRDSLVVSLRFMDSAISRLELVSVFPGTPESATLFVNGNGVVTDGRRIYYDPVYILKKYKEAPELCTRYYLHQVLHCVFQHFYINSLVDQELWDLACDIAIESIINELNISNVKVDYASKQANEAEKLKKEVKYLVAEKIYGYFLDSRPSPKEILRLQNLFSCDCHALWYRAPQEEEGEGDGEGDENNQSVNSGGGQSQDKEKDDSGGQSQDKEKDDDSGGGQSQDKEKDDSGFSLEEYKKMIEDWQNVSRQMQMDLETFSKEHGDSAGGMMQNLAAVNREKYDYTAFLKKFAVLGEAMKVN